MKLTNPQEILLSRRIEPGHNFILLDTVYQDRVAKNLVAKGLGQFVDFGNQYLWRHRSGYFNHFIPNERCLELMDNL